MQITGRVLALILAAILVLIGIGVGVLQAQQTGGGIHLLGDGEGNEAGEMGKVANPAEQPGISPDQARAAVLAAYPGGSVQTITLEHEQGALVYSV